MNQAPRLSAHDLQEELTRRSGRRVLLCLTDNRRRMVSVTSRNDLLEVRLQRIFLDSPPEVLDELAALLSGGGDRGTLRRFTADKLRERPEAARPPAPPSPARSRSGCHDILRYAEALNAAYLGGRSTARVIWGRRSRKGGRRSIRFACYDPERNLIIMNRRLDSPDIPAYFVEYILFHEMLHEVLGIGRRADGRRDIHGRLFKLMESTFPDHDRALRFEQDLCRRLGSL